jgi:hypothetical protein
MDLASANVQGLKDDDKTFVLLGVVAYAGYVLGDVGGVNHGIRLRYPMKFSFFHSLVLLLN